MVLNLRTNKSVKINSEYADQVRKFLEDPITQNDGFEQYLITNEFVVRNDFDEPKWVEYKHNEAIFGTDTLYVTLMPTNDCNFRCKYCFESNTPQYIDTESVNKIIKFFTVNIPKSTQVRLEWFGGEPLLCKEEVIEISEQVHDICKANKVPLYGTISTNGYLLDVDVFRKLYRSRIISYQICIDGNEIQHNNARPHCSNADSYKTIISNLLGA